MGNSMLHGADTANPWPQSGKNSEKNTRITPTSLLQSLMPLPTNSKPLKFKVSQHSNFSQLEEKCKTTTEAELLMISSNSLNQKELPMILKMPKKTVTTNCKIIRISLFSVLNKTSEVHFRSHKDYFRFIGNSREAEGDSNGWCHYFDICLLLYNTKFRDHMTLYSVSRDLDSTITGPGSNAISQNSSYSNFPPIRFSFSLLIPL